MAETKRKSNYVDVMQLRKKPHTDEIILNYGIEIEAVFELINVHTAYNQFINFYLNHIRNTYSGNKTINSTIISFIKLLKLCINKSSTNSVIRQLIASLITNEIYILLTPEKTEEVKKQEKEKLHILM